MVQNLTVACQDKELSDMLESNDRLLFDRLYKYYWNPLINYSFHYLKDQETCEEIVQDLFVHLHQRIDQLKVKTFSSYLYTALRNKIFNYFRDQAVYRKHMAIAAMERQALHCDTDQMVNFKELQNAVHTFLAQLPAKCREVYVLRNHEQLPLKEISAILQRPVNTIEKQLRKANRLLREELRRFNFSHRLN